MEVDIIIAEEKKFADEMLTDEQLNGVAGGTYGEYKELRELLPMVEYYSRILPGTHKKFKNSRYLTPNEVELWLKNELGIDANIDVGSKWNLFDSAGEKNTYSRNGSSLTHSEVIAEVKNYLGK